MFEGIGAELVWDGGDEVRIPEKMGAPRPGQMDGTTAERLTEISGRICYDSMGSKTSRSSADYIEHILQVGHTSIAEHYNATLLLESNNPNFSSMLAIVMLNRPGTWAALTASGGRVTLNCRSAMEFDKWSKTLSEQLPDFPISTAMHIGAVIKNEFHKLAPRLVKQPHPIEVDTAISQLQLAVLEPVLPKSDAEKWIALYTYGSRGYSHELIRHADFTAMCLGGDNVVTFVNKKGIAYSGNVGAGVRTMRWLYERWQDPRLRSVIRKLRPRVLDEVTGKFVPGKLLDVITSGKKPCFKISLANGSEITCTKDHRIYTDRGWLTLDEIAQPVLAQQAVQWNKNSDIKIAANGIETVEVPLHQDKEWLIKRYLTDGATMAEVAAEAGVKINTLRAALTRHGVKKRELTSHAGSLVQDRDWLHDQYRVRGMSHEEIGAVAGCSSAVVHNYCRKFGIQKERQEINLGRTPWNKGTTYSHTGDYSPESIERYRQSKLGAKNPQWKGGRGSEARRAFHAWKRQNGRLVFERDGWSCRLCDRHSSDILVNNKHMRKRSIEIHHIHPVWNRPDLACEVGNMATVCWECQATKLNGHEQDYAETLLLAIRSPVPYIPSDRKRPHGKRVVKVHYVEITSITYAGEIDTYDLVLEGPNHGFVANGIVVHNSQRSTRYCEESESPWTIHPLIQDFLKDENVAAVDRQFGREMVDQVVAKARHTYKWWVDKLVPYVADRIKDDPYAKTTARKQARGAARGFLGNALETELIFSANIMQWRHIILMRAAQAADGEIRVAACAALGVLKRSRYGDRFSDLSLVEAGDGTGLMLDGGGAA